MTNAIANTAVLALANDGVLDNTAICGFALLAGGRERSRRRLILAVLSGIGMLIGVQRTRRRTSRFIEKSVKE